MLDQAHPPRAGQEAIHNLDVAIAEASARVTVETPLPEVVGDISELVRLFQNLIGNAVKYRVAQRTPEVRIGAYRDDGQWVVWVKDNGIGIAPDDHDRVFGIFQRLPEAAAYEGTGIGLAVCRRIVEHHGGRIWVESELGQGASFYLSFPQADAGPARSG